MRLPRDVSGADLAASLERYGYSRVRQTGSHIRLVSTARQREHHVTVPAHKVLKVGTLAGILADVATYLGMERDVLTKELFE